MPHARPTPAERAIAAAFFAPIGLGAKVVEDLPDALTAARQQLVFARFIGKMAVDQGIRQLRERLGGAVSPTITPAENESDPEIDIESVEVCELSEVERPTAPVPDHDELALPDFDQLPAAHIVGKLDGLTADELDAVEAYERAHRHRRTVLGKIDQLRSA